MTTATSPAAPARGPLSWLTTAPDPWARLAVGTAVLLLGCGALSQAWVGSLAWWPFSVAALGAMLLVAFLRRIGGAFFVVVLVAAAVPLAAMVAIGAQTQLSPLESITRPLPVLLTTTYRAPITLPLLIPGLVVAWAAGAIIGLGLHRKDFWAEPLLAGVSLIVVGDLLTRGGSDMRGWLSFGIVAVVLAYWATWGRQPGETPRGLGAAALLGAVALAVGFVPLGLPFQPRDLVRPEVRPSVEPNPLQHLSEWAEQPDREILRRRGDPFALHLAVLPEYDGRGFYSSSRYFPLGGTQQPSLPGGRFQVDQTVTVTWQPMSRWLPAPGLPKTVSVPDAQLDPETGTLVLPEYPKGIFSYTVTGTIDAPRLHEIAGANVGPSGRYTQVPELPDQFRAYAEEVTRGTATYLEQAQGLERALKADRQFTATSISGTSIGRLRAFLFDPVDKGGRQGTSEQFAASFVVLARSLGMPTRLAVGFGSGQPLDPASGTHVVRGRDALAWPEVYFEGFGWVPFNPTPAVEEVSAASQNAPRTAPSPRPTPTAEPPVPPRVEPPPARRDEVPWGPIIGAVLAVALVGGLALARLARTRAQARDGALGAWRHVADALRLAGRRTHPHQAAVSAAAETGSTPASTVAAAAERATFAPPGSPAAGEVWDDAVLAARDLRRGAPWWRRTLWFLSPVVFWRAFGGRGR
ncbi:transglutaminase-like domain-containing protein [Mariniluteicoccus flavus]